MDEARLRSDIVELACQYGGHGYRRIAALFRDAGWEINDKRVERLWRREGLEVPAKHPKNGRLWLTDGLCVRLMPQYPNPVWSHDFVHRRTDDDRVLWMLNIIDDDTRECLVMRVEVG